MTVRTLLERLLPRSLLTTPAQDRQLRRALMDARLVLAQARHLDEDPGTT